MKKIESVKTSVSTAVTETKTVVKNLERLVESVALLVVAGFTIKQALEMERNAFFYLLVISGSIIAIRGAIEFLRHLARKD